MSKYAGFTSVQLTKPQRSEFDLSHEKRVTTRAARLTPILVQEAIPGDSFRGSSEVLVRVAPLLAPLYDRLRLFVHFFFVPYRLLWDEWETFITGGRLGIEADPAEAPIPPHYRFMDMEPYEGLFENSSLLDYLGMPNFQALTGFAWVDFTADATFDMLVPLAYQRCWYDYYRDRNFVDDSEMEFPVSSGNMDPAYSPSIYLQVQSRGWEHDYYTSALPFTQRGAEVLMPLAGSGSVTYLDEAQVWASGGASTTGGTADTFYSFGSAPPADAPGIPPGSDVRQAVMSDSGSPAYDFGIANIDEVLLESSAVSMNDFRSAYALQVWLERNAIAGSRYNESSQAHFGVRPQDSRLQRPEYIGGGLINIQISEVVSTAYSNDGADVVPLANMAGHGIAYGNTNRFRYFCPEHGVILGIASITYPGTYYQGMPRWFRRKTFLDFPWPVFAKLGEQPIYNYELYCLPSNFVEDSTGEPSVFGYTSRYADWKHQSNSSHGEFRDSLLFWTLARNFTTTPVLSQAFTIMNGIEQNRIFAIADDDGDNFWLYVHNNVSVRRCLPYFGQPNTLGFS